MKFNTTIKSKYNIGDYICSKWYPSYGRVDKYGYIVDIKLKKNQIKYKILSICMDECQNSKECCICGTIDEPYEEIWYHYKFKSRDWTKRHKMSKDIEKLFVKLTTNMSEIEKIEAQIEKLEAKKEKLENL